MERLAAIVEPVVCEVHDGQTIRDFDAARGELKFTLAAIEAAMAAHETIKISTNPSGFRVAHYPKIHSWLPIRT